MFLNIEKVLHDANGPPYTTKQATIILHAVDHCWRYQQKCKHALWRQTITGIASTRCCSRRCSVLSWADDRIGRNNEKGLIRIPSKANKNNVQQT